MRITRLNNRESRFLPFAAYLINLEIVDGLLPIKKLSLFFTSECIHLPSVESLGSRNNQKLIFHHFQSRFVESSSSVRMQSNHLSTDSMKIMPSFFFFRSIIILPYGFQTLLISFRFPQLRFYDQKINSYIIEVFSTYFISSPTTLTSDRISMKHRDSIHVVLIRIFLTSIHVTIRVREDLFKLSTKGGK